mmetsp:Transcript_45833/g.33569  ORF Transcript_45833/g.33569 Transcript_45833/m.33569 type:complete len:107 (+) Transcript_45833:132-452(+)
MMLILKIHWQQPSASQTKESKIDAKEVSFSLVKKILKARVWEIREKSAEEADFWDCIKMGLCLFFTQNPSKEKYKLFKEYLDSKIRREMQENNEEFDRIYNQFARK